VAFDNAKFDSPVQEICGCCLTRKCVMLINQLEVIPGEINRTDCQVNFIYFHFNIILAFTAFSTDIFHSVILKK
jgi:hypothetical protein